MRIFSTTLCGWGNSGAKAIDWQKRSNAKVRLFGQVKKAAKPAD